MAKDPSGPKQSQAPVWQQSEPVYTVGKAHIDGMDHIAQEMERKWGVGRLRLLVPADLRAKFDSQWQKVNKAIWHGELADVQTETQRMVNAWRKLDQVATASQCEILSPATWEARMPDGKVLVFVRDSAEAWHVHQSGRKVIVYSMDQIVAILAENERRVIEEGRAAASFDKPNSHVEPVHDKGSSAGWDDEVPFG